MPSLHDPLTCGEDLAQQASRMAELAPMLCADCAEYHIRFAVTRYVEPFDKAVAVDRALLIQRVQQIMAETARRSDGLLNIVIAGAADTGVLATCAHATATLSDQVHARCRFTVLDRCRTPLALCAEFAHRHALSVQTAEIDLLAGSEHFDADLIVCHSLLRFMDRLQQIAFLKKLDTWLKPGGRMIVSQSIRPREEAAFGKEAVRLESSLALVRAAIASGAIRIGPEAEPVLQRMYAADHGHLQRRGDIDSAGELRDLMLAAGLREHSLDVIEHELPSAGLTRMRAVAVFGSSRET